MYTNRLLSLLFLGVSLSASAQLKQPQVDLPNPLLMNDGTTVVENLNQWTARRQEISQMIQQYGHRSEARRGPRVHQGPHEG